MKFSLNQSRFNQLWQGRRRNKIQLTPKKKLAIAFIAVSLVSFLAGVNFHNLIPAATVNGEAISRADFSRKLLKVSGQSVLNELVTERLLHQEAERQNVTISQKEINTKIDQVSFQFTRQGMTDQARLAKDKKTRPDLEREIRNQLLIDKLFGKNIIITDRDIEKYLTDHHVSKGNGAIWESQKIAVNQLLHQQKLQQKFLTWINLKKKDARVRVLLSI